MTGYDWVLYSPSFWTRMARTSTGVHSRLGFRHADSRRVPHPCAFCKGGDLDSTKTSIVEKLENPPPLRKAQGWGTQSKFFACRERVLLLIPKHTINGGGSLADTVPTRGGGQFPFGHSAGGRHCSLSAHALG